MVPLRSKVTDRHMILGFTMALGAGICYGTTNVIGKRVVDDYDHPLLVSFFALMFGMLIMVSIAHASVPRAIRNSRNSLVPIILAGACSGTGVIGTYFALSGTDVVVAAPVISSAPLVTLILAHFMLRSLERITWRLVVGTLMIVLGVILIVFGR